MSYENILQDIKNKKYAPVYFLIGDEPFFIDKITDCIAKHVLAEHERDFNQTIFYGKDADAAVINDTARRFPMMAERQVVIVKEAQNLKNIELLQTYTDNPLNSTILVINYKGDKSKKTTSLINQIKKTGVVFESKKLRDYQIAPWIKKYAASKKMTIDDRSTLLLAEYLGTDLSKITNAIEKLIINSSGSKKITAESIEKNIGISKDYNIFELQNALGVKDVLKANKIVNYFAANEKNNPLVVTIIRLNSYFSNVLKFYFLKNKQNDQAVAKNLGIHPFFVKEYRKASQLYPPKKLVLIIALLREYDLKSKGVNNVSTNHGELLKELIFKILH